MELRLDELVSRTALPSLSFVASHTDGAALLATMDGLGLEGVVSKRTHDVCLDIAVCLAILYARHVPLLEHDA